ncbi:type II toxin-antitoxin system YhaV family toxin [Phormidium sp. LEGE 05292]|uniref:type II toxin-antitoxin system YhaV family toxin n=1 Tax=[Phormidium] sp. LEGE 05292 TaxID=767427 RepID=UPI0018827D0C|nr:type II toxin-antitoxin system YhaV family toxin [Phormidium sp. LEGE 05292]MBE9225370.1 type II toxin-antitoxin system YhaV family toxin [Phormidium sp. LEGE 05292]
MTHLISHGWNIRFHPLFSKQRLDLVNNVKKIKDRLSDEKEYRSHPQVKLFLAVRQGYLEHIPSDPFSLRFALKDDLRRYSRLKGMGLPNRYRLFFRVYQQEEQKEIVILWLGYPRKEGDKNDCYAVFQKMVLNGTFPASMQELIEQCEIGNGIIEATDEGGKDEIGDNK